MPDGYLLLHMMEPPPSLVTRFTPFGRNAVRVDFSAMDNNDYQTDGTEITFLAKGVFYSIIKNSLIGYEVHPNTDQYKKQLRAFQETHEHVDWYHVGQEFSHKRCRGCDVEEIRGELHYG